MSEYIRKEDVLNLPQSIERNLCGEIVERSIDVKDIESLEPADVALVRHARWRHYEGMYACEDCGAQLDDESPFCPMCGAKMDGECRER